MDSKRDESERWFLALVAAAEPLATSALAGGGARVAPRARSTDELRAEFIRNQRRLLDHMSSRDRERLGLSKDAAE